MSTPYDWPAALRAALIADHIRDGASPEDAPALADRTIATTRPAPYVDDEAAEVIAEDRAHERGQRLARYIERRQP